MTTEEKKPPHLKIVDGPRFKTMMGIFLRLGDRIVTFKMQPNGNRQFEQFVGVIITTIPYYENYDYITGYVVADFNLQRKMGMIDDDFNNGWRIYFTGKYDIEKATGEVYAYFFNEKTGSVDHPFNENVKIILPPEIEAITKFQHGICCRPQPQTVAITEEQIAELKKIIMNSPDGDDFGKKAICWLLDKSENLTKRVALTFGEDFSKQGKSASHTAHAFVSDNGATHFNNRLKSLKTDFMLMNHGCSFVNNDWTDNKYKNGGTIWISNVRYDPKPTVVYGASSFFVNEIENYVLEKPARTDKNAEEKLRELIKTMPEPILSVFTRQTLLFIINESDCFTKSVMLVFPAEFYDYGVEIHKSFGFIEQWSEEFLKQFNTDFVFNYHFINGVFKVTFRPPHRDESLSKKTHTFDKETLIKIFTLKTKS